MEWCIGHMISAVEGYMQALLSHYEAIEGKISCKTTQNRGILGTLLESSAY